MPRLLLLGVGVTGTDPKEYFLLAPITTTMAAHSLASFTSTFWIELPGVTRPTRTIWQTDKTTSVAAREHNRHPHGDTMAGA